MLVWQRDQGRCVRCGRPAVGEWSIQHRRARGMGGTRRPDANSAANLVVLCGSATTGCHGWVESHPTEAARWGYRVAQNQDPAQVAVWWHGRWVGLTEDGRIVHVS